MASKGKQSQAKGDKAPTGPQKMKFEKLDINKWDGNAVKNALDDTVKKILKEEFEFSENCWLVDIRLAISTIGVAFALTALVYDYLFPFPASKIVLAICSVSYFILMGIQSMYTMYIEKNTFMVANEQNKAGLGAPNVWKLDSTMPRFSHMYTLNIHYTNGNTKETSTGTIEKSIAEWFDVDGNLLIDKFFTDIQTLMTTTSKSKKE